MARSDYVEATLNLLYGQGLGEKPSIRLAAADAAESISTNTMTFDLATGDGANVKAGHILSVMGATRAASYGLYVTDVSTDTLTVLRTYRGSPDAGGSADLLDGAVFYQNPLAMGHEIHDMIDRVVDRMLWPQVWDYDTATVTPDLTDGQVELPATVMDLDSAYQIIGGEAYPVPFAVQRNVHTTVSSTGVLGTIGAINGSTVYYTSKSKFTIGDESGDDAAVVHLVALGAAALLVGGEVAAAEMERAKKDAQNRDLSRVENIFLRDFLTLREGFMSEEAGEYSEILVARSI